MILRIGSSGHSVARLQTDLRAAGLYPWRVDGIYGQQTARAVLAFQLAQGLLPDGVAGPQTLGALSGLVPAGAPSPSHTEAAAAAGDPGDPLLHRCHRDTWRAWLRLRDLVTGSHGEPVRYGPGRGLWVPGQGWVITHGPGRLGSTRWRSKAGRSYPSLHCSSWTNLFLGWLTGRGEDFTHAGNIPALDRLCTASGEELHKQALGRDGRPVAAPFRGYGERCMRLSGKGRMATVSWRQVHQRRGELGTFNVFAQSSRKASGRWKWWHHTGLLVCDHSKPHKPLTRIAADGYAGTGRVYSATPMDEEQIDTHYCARAEGRVLLYVFRVRPNADGTFTSDGSAPLPMRLEAL